MERLLPELITEILARLPPKGVLRMRCLSKSYCSLIDGEEFIKLHLQRSLRADARQAVIFHNKDKLGFQLVDDPLVARPCEEHLTLPLDLKGLFEEAFRTCGSCHGLVALADCDYDDNIVIWNPNTRKYRILSSRYPFSRLTEDKRIAREVTIGIGHDPLSDDYKLVELGHLRHWRRRGISPQLRPEVRVYSFKSDEWRWISEEVPGQYRDVGQFDWASVQFHEALHFEFYRNPGPGEGNGRRCILALDLRTERFRQLAELPVSQIPKDVVVLGGQLCAVFDFFGEEREVWAIKDYGGKEESWAKLFRFSLPLCPSRQPSPRPLDDPESSDTALIDRHWSDLVWADLVERERFEYVGSGDGGRYLQDATLLVPSIVSVGGENRERHEETPGLGYRFHKRRRKIEFVLPGV